MESFISGPRVSCCERCVSCPSCANDSRTRSITPCSRVSDWSQKHEKSHMKHLAVVSVPQFAISSLLGTALFLGGPEREIGVHRERQQLVRNALYKGNSSLESCLHMKELLWLRCGIAAMKISRGINCVKHQKKTAVVETNSTTVKKHTTLMKHGSGLLVSFSNMPRRCEELEWPLNRTVTR